MLKQTPNSMSSHNDHHDNHSNEPKKVAFGTPLILGLVTVFAILLLVSIGDNKKGCCEGDAKCEHHEGKHRAEDGHHAAAEAHDNAGHSEEAHAAEEHNAH